MRGASLLALAIACEVAATLALKAASTTAAARPWAFGAAALAGYAIAFLCLARSLETLPVGLAYAVWAGVGTVGVALLGAFLFRETPPLAAWCGVALVVAGVLVLGATLPPRA